MYDKLFQLIVYKLLFNSLAAFGICEYILE